MFGISPGSLNTSQETGSTDSAVDLGQLKRETNPHTERLRKRERERMTEERRISASIGRRSNTQTAGPSRPTDARLSAFPNEKGRPSRFDCRSVSSLSQYTDRYPLLAAASFTVSHFHR